MDAPYPYHESEHYEQPKTQTGLIREFMRHYSAGPESRAAVVAFIRIYGDRKLLHGMREDARLMREVRAAQTGEHQEQGIDMHFYFGELLSVHTILQALSTEQRQTLLECDHLNMYRTDKTYRYGTEDLRHIIESLGRWRTEGYQIAMSNLDAEIGDAILDLATHIYEDCEVMSDVESFMAGFVFAGNVLMAIQSTLEQMPKPPIYMGPV